jgi:zinc transport system substrate-binding protein
MWKQSLSASLLLALLACGCTEKPGVHKLRVTCSIFPLADIASNVGGDGVDVQVLIPPGASPHTFEPSPREFKTFADTRVFVMVGAGFEFWAEKLVTAASSESLVVVLASGGVDLIEGLASHDRANQHHSDNEHANPHIWLDPLIAKRIAYRIAASLAEVDMVNAADYLTRATEYTASLDSLDSEIRESVSAFQIKEYVAFHPAWSYFARQYGLTEVGIIEESPGREPTPRQFKKIVEDIRKYNIKAVFAEPQLSAKAASAIAAETGVELLLLDPLGGRGLPERDSYLKLMRYNLSVMKRAMG